MSDVVVVGGGLAGLVIARKLLVEGLSVTIVEAGPRLGGSIARHVVGGLTLDAGAESFAIRGGTVEALLGDLGLGPEIVRPNPTGAWLWPANGQAAPLPKLSLLGIPGSPAAADVSAIIGSGASLRAFVRDSLLPGTVGSKAATIGELVRIRMGNTVADELVAPVINGVHSASPDDVALDRVAPHLRAALRRTGSLARAVQSLAASAAPGSSVGGIRGGLARIVDELVADIERFGGEVRLNTRASAVEPDAVHLDGEVLSGHVVVAAPGLLPGTRTPARVVTLATLVVRAPQLDAAPRGTGVLVAKGATGIRARALTHATAKWQWLAERAEGLHVLRLSYGEDPLELADIARSDAAALLGVELPSAAVVDFARVQWSRTTVSEIAPDGITVVGEAIAGTGLANIIGHSLAQAATVVERLSGEPG